MAGEDPAGVADPQAKPLAEADADEAVALEEALNDEFDDAPKDPSKGFEPSAEEVPAKKEFPIREISVGPLRFNWCVSVIGLVVLWGVAIFCMTSETAKDELQKWYDTTVRPKSESNVKKHCYFRLTRGLPRVALADSLLQLVLHPW